MVIIYVIKKNKVVCLLSQKKVKPCKSVKLVVFQDIGPIISR